MAIWNRAIGVVLGCASLASAMGALAQDWPQWRGPNRDGKAAGFEAPQTWPKTLEAKWRTKVGTGDATPALAGDKLFVFTRQGGNEVIRCLEAESGKQVWQEKYAARAVTGPAASQHAGPRSSPTVADGKVVTLGASGILSCLDAATGKVAWRSEVLAGRVPQFYTAMSPIVVDGMCIAYLGGEGEGAAIAFELASGNQKWKWTGDSPTYSSPVVMSVEGTKQLVLQGEKTLAGVSLSDGKQLWQITTPTQRRFYSSATPIVDGSTVIFTGQGTGTKAVAIEKSDGGFAAKELWANAKLGTSFNTPVLKDGLLFGLSDRGNFFCLDAKTGKTAWSDSAKQDRFGAIVDAGAVLLALPANSQLIAFKPDGKKFAELATIKVADSPTYAHPIASGKRIFVKDRDAVAMFAVE